MRNSISLPLLALTIAALPGCSAGGGANVPGGEDTRPYSGIAPDETLQFTGTEPFWGGQVAGDRLLYTTQEEPEGRSIAVSRFAGRGGLAYSGALAGRSFDMAVTPAPCSDGMSDRTYPFVVTLRIGDETREGCGWTDATPFSGPS